jgi:hypothetical protein
MKSLLSELDQVIETKPQIEGVRVGKVVKVEAGGQVWVDYPGNTFGPLPARQISSIGMELLTQAAKSDKEVLLVFENNNPRLPIIIDTLYSLLDELTNDSKVTIEADSPKEIILDGKRLLFNAEEEIVLRCGKGSITLKQSGKIIVKGTYLLNCSTGVNKIKGATVKIN